MIRGNHDKVVCGLESGDLFNPVALKAARWTTEKLTPRNRRFLEALPLGPATVDGAFAICHGSPARRGRLHLHRLRRLPEFPGAPRRTSASSGTATSRASSRSSRTGSWSSSSRTSASAIRSRRGCATSSTRARSDSLATATPRRPTRSTTRRRASCTSTACLPGREDARQDLQGGAAAHPRGPAARRSVGKRTADPGRQTARPRIYNPGRSRERRAMRRSLGALGAVILSLAASRCASRRPTVSPPPPAATPEAVGGADARSRVPIPFHRPRPSPCFWVSRTGGRSTGPFSTPRPRRRTPTFGRARRSRSDGSGTTAARRSCARCSKIGSRRSATPRLSPQGSCAIRP